MGRRWLSLVIAALSLAGCGERAGESERPGTAPGSAQPTARHSPPTAHRSPPTADSPPPTADSPPPTADSPPLTAKSSPLAADRSPLTADSPPPTDHPFVRLLSPADEEVVPNPVEFRFEAGGGVESVALFVDELPLLDRPLPATAGSWHHRFRGVNTVRQLRVEGYAADGKLVAAEESLFLPAEGYIVPPPGFNRFVVAVINDLGRYPRDGRHPYCWRECPGSMGVIHSTWFEEQLHFEGEGSCFCSGFTLELFLAALERWRAWWNRQPDEPFGMLTMAELRGGPFYQYWQGYGVTESASSAEAFAHVGIGYGLGPDRWEEARAGDFVNFSRSDGTGHAVIFHSWVREQGVIVGLRYFGCNRRGDSHPDPTDPNNQRVSGPSFNSSRFTEAGGKILSRYLFIGRVEDPETGM